MHQIPLSLSLSPSYKPDEFILGGANQDAVAWLSAWPDWPMPYRVLNIFGVSGSGKTHLSHVFEARSNACRLAELQDIKSLVESPYQHFILDDFTLGEQFSQEALFHFFNHLASINGTALLLSQISAARMEPQLADLRSRLRAIACQEITAPDDSLLAQVLQKMFADRQCNVPDTVIRYMVTHMERNFTTAFQLVGKIDTAALAAKKPVSLAIAKSIMAPETIEFEFDLKHRNEEI